MALSNSATSQDICLALEKVALREWLVSERRGRRCKKSAASREDTGEVRRDMSFWLSGEDPTLCIESGLAIRLINEGSFFS